MTFFFGTPQPPQQPPHSKINLQPGVPTFYCGMIGNPPACTKNHRDIPEFEKKKKSVLVKFLEKQGFQIYKELKFPKLILKRP